VKSLKQRTSCNQLNSALSLKKPLIEASETKISLNVDSDSRQEDQRYFSTRSQPSSKSIVLPERIGFSPSVQQKYLEKQVFQKQPLNLQKLLSTTNPLAQSVSSLVTMQPTMHRKSQHFLAP